MIASTRKYAAGAQEDSNSRRASGGLRTSRGRGGRPARFFEPQEHGPFVSYLSCSPPAEAQRAPTSAARRVGWRRTARLTEPQEHSQQFRPIYNPNLSCSACRPSPPRRSAPGRQGRRPKGSQKQHLIHSPNPLSSSSGTPPPAPAYGVRCATRTAIPLGIALLAISPNSAKKHSPTHHPILRPVSTSLRLRCRSAAFSRALRDSSIFGYRRNS